jgi:hypothetical protein
MPDPGGGPLAKLIILVVGFWGKVKITAKKLFTGKGDKPQQKSGTGQ